MGIIITKSDIGVIRKQNEDYCWAGENGKDILLIVCDGLGSYEGSKYASRIAVDVFKESFILKEYKSKKLNEWFIDNINKIKDKFKIEISKNPKFKNMSTTIVLSLIHGNIVHTFWVGDSRSYLIYKNDFEQITTDHNVINRLQKLNASREIFDQFKNDLFAITHFIDSSNQKQQYDYIKRKLRKNSGIILSSDGFHNFININKIYNMLTDKDNIDINAENLVKKAIENNSDDNITYVWYYNGK